MRRIVSRTLAVVLVIVVVVLAVPTLRLGCLTAIGALLVTADPLAQADVVLLTVDGGGAES